MITFEQARQIVIAKLSGEYLPEADFKVKPYGWENATEYQLIWSVNDNFMAPSNGPYPIVNKTTGAYRQEDGPPYELPNSVKTGNWPPPVEESDEPVDPDFSWEDLERL